MSNRRCALSRFSGDKVAYRSKHFLGLFTKPASIFDYKRDEIAVIKLLVCIFVSGVLDVFFEPGCVPGVFCGICTVRWSPLVVRC